MILADKGYSGPNILKKKNKNKKKKPTKEQEKLNKEIDKHRIVVENVFARIKNWSICSHKFRCKATDTDATLAEHNEFWYIVASLCNLFTLVR